MARCEVCGNDYDKSFRVETAAGTRHTFDSVECAAQVLAPQCAHCNVRIMGHGLEYGGRVFCCAHCASAAGIAGFTDRIAAP
mgnify:CR=1 FL=1|jgi:hypothetical protein